MRKVAELYKFQQQFSTTRQPKNVPIWAKGDNKVTEFFGQHFYKTRKKATPRANTLFA